MQLLKQSEGIKSAVIVAPLILVTLIPPTNEEAILYNNNEAWKTAWEEDKTYQETI